MEMDMRQFDPAIARWTSIDPVTHFGNSTYNGFDNNPIYWADPSGADGISVASGTYTGAAAVDVFNQLKDQYGGSGGSTQTGESEKTPKHQFYGVNLTGDVMNLSFDKKNFNDLTGYGEDPTDLYKIKYQAFYSTFKGLSKAKQLKLLKKLKLPLKIFNKLASHPISPAAAISAMTRAEKNMLKAAPILGPIVEIMTSDFESDGRSIANEIKWDDVRDGFNNMINTETLNDVILIYSNTNLFNKKTINTNETEVSDSRFPQRDYKYVYYGTQHGETLHIFGRYDNPLRE